MTVNDFQFDSETTELIPLPQFLPRDQVAVLRDGSTSEGGILGQLGIVVWRSSMYCARRLGNRNAPGWIYVVQLPERGFAEVLEGEMIGTGRVEPLSALLGKRFELSFDQLRSAEASCLTGTFRQPGRFWSAFRCFAAPVRHVAFEWSLPVVGHARAVHQLRVQWPEDCEINARAVEQALGNALSTSDWKHVRGPRSDLLC
jgi:hypothetical protein